MTRTDPRRIALALVAAAITGTVSLAAVFTPGFESGSDQAVSISPLLALACLVAFSGLLGVRTAVRVRR